MFFLFFILYLTDSQAQIIFESKTLNLTSKLPIEGANILIKNTNKGAFTDLDGNFKIQIDLFPTTLIITHLGYKKKEIQITNDSQKNNPIYLEPLYNILENITIRHSYEEVSISNAKEYSILDFEVFDESILRLELHGARSYVLTLTDLDGNKKATTKLEKIKRIDRLFTSCNDNLYLVCSNYAFQIFSSEVEIDLGPQIPIDTFNNFIETCKLRLGNKLYYQVDLHNGLQKNISSYDLLSQEHNLFIIISNQTQLHNYLDDLSLINQSQTITNISTNDIGENERIRNLQENGDFYLTVFYKPEFPIYLSNSNEQILLFNHIEGKLQKYNIDDDKLAEIEIEYMNDEKWLKLIIIDQSSNAHYAICNHKKGLALKEIDLDSGSAELVAIIESNNVQYKNMKIHNGYLFYLKTRNSLEKNKGLMKYKI